MLSVLSAGAAERSQTAMQAIANRYLNMALGVKNINGATFGSVTSKCVFEGNTYAVFAPQTDNAFVIVSKSDLTEPVIGYAQSSFSPAKMPDGLRWFLSVAERNIADAEATQMPQSISQRRIATTPVEPFITTLWHQSAPYNLLTPNNYPAGCVAVAMAQCMNYCQHPGNVNFRGYAYCSETPGGKRYKVDSLDIQGIYFFPFLNMYGRATDRQKNSVAKFIRDCGYATYMQYDKNGSGTYNYLAGSALTTCFNYPEKCIKYAERAFFQGTDEEWNNIIYREMEAKCPIIYGGQDEQEGGHAFVFCGLDADGLVYVNWGWGGDSDGYYNIQLLNPSTMKFKDGQDMIYGIRTEPYDTDRAEPRIFSYDGNPYTFSFKEETDDNGVAHKTIHITSTAGFFNITPSTFDGEFGLFGLDVTTGEPWEIKETDPITWESGTGYFLREPAELFYYYVENEMVPGHTYRLSFGSRDKVEQVWHSIIAHGGEVAYDIYYTGKETTTTISERKEAYIVDRIKEVGYQQPNPSNQTRVYDLQGRLIYTAPTAQFNFNDVPTHGTFIVKQGDKVRKVLK